MRPVLGPATGPCRVIYFALISAIAPTCCLAQIQAGVYDFGLGRYGEKRGSWTPGEWLGAILLIMIICLGLAVAIGLCYYVTKRQTRRTFGASLQQQGREVRRRNQLGEFVLVPGDSTGLRGPNQKGYSQNNDSLVVQI